MFICWRKKPGHEVVHEDGKTRCSCCLRLRSKSRELNARGIYTIVCQNLAPSSRIWTGLVPNEAEQPPRPFHTAQAPK